MNDCISWIIDGHVEKECVIKPSLVCAPVTPMAISNKHKTDTKRTEINVWVLDFKTGYHGAWHEFMESKKAHSGAFFFCCCVVLSRISKHVHVNLKNPTCLELIFRHVFLSKSFSLRARACIDLFHHLQPRMTLIPVSSPHPIHLSRALHCPRRAFKWHWYIRHITKTKGRQGPSFCAH